MIGMSSDLIFFLAASDVSLNLGFDFGLSSIMRQSLEEDRDS